MRLDRLYLLEPHFMDPGKGPYFCPGYAQIVGLLRFYPALKNNIEGCWLDFPRPRPELIELQGEENQSCPVLVLRAEAGRSAWFRLPDGLHCKVTNCDLSPSVLYRASHVQLQI